MIQEKAWFATWFDSPYYHILYKNRDEREAEVLMNNLCSFLQIQPSHQVLDLACGRGRHAIYLNNKGFHVTGIDLSAQSIAHAKCFENERLHFFEHDMRHVFERGRFDYVFNLFTSFGYFDTKTENLQAIKATTQNLKNGGVLVIDFMNSQKVIQELVLEETKTIDAIDFHIKRSYESPFILKNIDFEHQGQHYSFQEKVMAISKLEFESYFEAVGLDCIHLFGNYALEPFQDTSDRMIFILQKNASITIS